MPKSTYGPDRTDGPRVITVYAASVYHACALETVATGTLAYVAAACSRSAALFARHGFRVGVPFDLPGGPAVYPMWRSPR